MSGLGGVVECLRESGTEGEENGGLPNGGRVADLDHDLCTGGNERAHAGRPVSATHLDHAGIRPEHHVGHREAWAGGHQNTPRSMRWCASSSVISRHMRPLTGKSK